MRKNITTSAPAGANSSHIHSLHPSQVQKTPSHHEALSTTSILMILIPIIIGILLAAIVLLIVMLRRLQCGKGCHTSAIAKTKNFIKESNCMFIAHTTINFNPTPEVNGGCLYGSSLGSSPQLKCSQLVQVPVQVLSLKEVETATSKFSEENLIGKGGSGEFYRGIMKDGSLVAIKMLHIQGKQGERAFRLEVDLLSRMRSPYIVELVGYCADQHHRILVFKCMPNGSLKNHLHPPNYIGRGRALSWGIRLKIALDCARALEYLHEHIAPSVIHRNLKCSNILLDHNFRAKLSGFRLAKIGSDKLNGLISTRVMGTTGYLAPEYASTGKLTTKSDVYSFGVILLELLTGRVPVDTTRPPGEHVLVSWALPRLTNRDKVMEMVDPALQGQYSSKDLIQVAAVAAMCIQTEADYRPLMTDVVHSLIPLVKNLSVPSCPSTSLKFNQSASPKS